MYVCFFKGSKKTSRAKSKNSRLRFASIGQVSLEYLLLLAAFFSVLGIIFPVITSSSQAFLESSDVLLAKKMAAEISEKASLLAFLADGSQFSLEYSPAKEVVVYSQGSQIVAEASGKSFFAQTNSQQFLVRESFTRNFKIILRKAQNNVQVIAESSQT